MGTGIDRPLWQIILPLLLLGLALQRGAAGLALHLAGMGPLLVAAYALQCAVALATARGLWLGRPWTVVALIALGMLIAASSLLQGFWLGVHPPIASVSEVLIVALSTGALALALRGELGRGGDRGARLL